MLLNKLLVCFRLNFLNVHKKLLFSYLMNVSRQEEERRRREEEMMIRQREMEEQMRRQREESYSRMGYMDPVSKLLQCNWSFLQNLWISRVQFYSVK